MRIRAQVRYYSVVRIFTSEKYSICNSNRQKVDYSSNGSNFFSDATFSKKTFKYCYKGKYPPNGYNTVEEAKNACEKDDICGKVYDKNCDNVGPFYLCPVDSPEYGSMSSCLYVKDSIGNFQKR